MEFGLFSTNKQTRGLGPFLTALDKKEAELAVAAAKNDQNAKNKYTIIKQLNATIKITLDSYVRNAKEDETKEMILLIQRLKKNIDLIVNKTAIATLMVHRNNNQYYANAAYGGGALLGGIVAVTAMPQTFIGALSCYLGVSNALFSYVHGFDNYIPSSMKTIYSFYEKLSMIEHRLLLANPQYTVTPPTYYEILGVGENANNDDINRAYRQLAKLYHPDKNNGDDAKFVEINKAKEILCDDDARKEYDYERIHANRRRELRL
jgi:hypothetical protein